LEPAIVIDPHVGQHKTDVDFHLPKAGRLDGHVLDERGRPAPAIVALLYAASNSTDPIDDSMSDLLSIPAILPKPVRTDHEGHFRMEDIVPGDYNVTAIYIADEHRRTKPAIIYPRAYYPDVWNRRLATAVHISGGHQNRADILLRPAPAFSVSGFVHDSDGRPVAAGFVRFGHVEQGRFDLSVSGGFTRTAGNGSFDISGLEAGNYTLVASTGVPWSRPGVQADIQTRATNVTVGAGSSAPINLTTQPGGMLRGVELFEDGLPEAGIDQTRVVGVPVAGSEISPGPTGSAAVNNEGHFELHNVFGRIVIQTQMPRVETWFVRSVTYNGFDITETGIDVRSSQTVSKIHITLSDKVGALRGRVTLRDQVLRNGVVLLFSSDARKWTYPQQRFVRMARTDASGNYLISGIVPGQYRVYAIETFRDSGLPTSYTLSRFSAKAAGVRIEPSADMVMDLAFKD
jgi:protocatechuate 3,4-dioxygenase beta subunit